MTEEENPMSPNTQNERLNEATKNFNKVLPKAWEIARKNTEADKKNYAAKRENGGK
jgi:hypothetical protein